MTELRPIGPDERPLLDAQVTCPACQSQRVVTSCDLCGLTRLVRRGVRDKWIVEQELRMPLDGRARPYDLP